MLRKGLVCLPSETGPVVARNDDGQTFDPFDVVDRLIPQYGTVYVVDLDGIERGQPQLDYLQELSREVAIWVDGGVRVADQAIDILVAGASKAVLSSATLAGPKEVRRAWKLSPEVAFEIDLTAQGPTVRGDWAARDARGIAAFVRENGPQELIVSPREISVDWELARSLAATGPVWLDGSFSEREAPELARVGAAGGIFHLDGMLGGGARPLPSGPSPTGRSPAR